MKLKIKMLLILFLSFCNSIVKAQDDWSKPTFPNGFWEDLEQLDIPKENAWRTELPEKFRLLKLETQKFEDLLRTTKEVTDDALKTSATILDIPLPDGSFQKFRLEKMQVMHPDLAKKFPSINSYSGWSEDGLSSKLYFAFSPIGLHALIFSEGKSPVMIEPIAKGDTEHYLSFYNKDFGNDALQFECSVKDKPTARSQEQEIFAFAGDCQLRTYRLAVATTAELTATFISPMDPTGVNGTLASINALVTLMNGFFINEFAIQLQLIPNNNLILFTNAAMDGFTDGNQNTMASDAESQSIIDMVIGAGNYDIGHSLGTNATMNSGSGVSLQIGNVCVNGNKANAATIMNPVNPPGFINLIMHEFGHQFGANHTFNESSVPICSNAGQLNGGTAFEPGSGSTIMSYGGTCGVSNVQGGRDQYFHAISLQEIGNYVTGGNGNNCPIITPLSNNQPTVNAGSDFNIPVSTPFMLSATANDLDGDNLTFCWEQMDNQIINHPPQSTATNGPVFRSVLPGVSPTRFFPNLSALVSGTPTPWEVLPSVARTMNFRATVRDNVAGGGCTNEDNMQVEVFDDAGPFVVTAPAGGVCLQADDMFNISWDVAGTDGGDVNCANVDIFLSTDGGQTFSLTLVAGTPNDGTHDMALPSLFVEEARIMVKCSDNIFFNINPGNFTIDCIAENIVTDNPVDGTHRARERVETSGTVTVEAFTSVRFLAGEEVLLTDGFSALFNSMFLASIQPCIPCVDNAPSALTTQDVNPKIYFYEKIEKKSNSEISHQGMKAFLYPNPVGETFTIAFEMIKDEKVQIQLIDLTGQYVKMIYENELLEKGIHHIPVEQTRITPGVYYCRIIVEGKTEMVKLVKLN